MSSDAAHLVATRKAEAAANYRAVHVYFSTHLCATQAECAKALGLSVMAVNRHVRAKAERKFGFHPGHGRPSWFREAKNG